VGLNRLLARFDFTCPGIFSRNFLGSLIYLVVCFLRLGRRLADSAEDGSFASPKISIKFIAIFYLITLSHKCI
jgi:hypothetical protein